MARGATIWATRWLFVYPLGMRFLCLAILSVSLVACGDDDSPTDGSVGDGITSGDVATDGSAEDGSTDGSTSDGSSDGTSVDGSTPDGTVTDMSVADVPPTLCPDCPACSNGVDDDGDGLIDGADPECTAPNDNDEGSFGTGIPGDNRDPVWQDCFFDGNSGGGDDGCRYRTGCLTGELPPSDDDCTLSDECIMNCQPSTPNGCDCFGCCEIFVEGTPRLVQIGDGCSIDDLDSCATCVQAETCMNECGTCELCPGRTLEDLPPECSPDMDGGMPMYMCEDGVTCASDANCMAGQYCSQGCCLDFVLL